MATTFKNMMREVMNMAHRAFQLKGAYMSWTECLKQAWQVIKLKARMKKQVVEFYFQKVDGSLREAFGTLSEKVIPATQGAGRKMNDTCQVYFDTEKEEWRCFKKANLMRVA